MARRAKWSVPIGQIMAEIKEDHRQVAIGAGLELFARLIIKSPVGDPSLWESNRVAREYNADVASYNADLRQDPASLNRAGRLRKGLKLNDSMKVRMPAGYTGGHFKGNWSLATTGEPTGTVETIDPAGNATIAKGQAALGAFTLGQTISIRNNLPYSVRLEYGWSKQPQASGGMVRTTEVEFPEIVRSIAAGQRNKQ